ncbi:MAG: histone deacetylase, partial [Peptococcaceae bacterium]|nr:histone deacetylase [Peptococcaceae bacterium]
FYHDPNVLFISFHQDGNTIYPGTGFINELGGPGAYGRTINIPLPPGMADNTFNYVVDNLVLPIIKDFKPDFIINSAGQDNHFTDPLGSMKFTARGYADFTRKLNPHLAVLEGGYAIETALPYVNMSILMALAGIDYSNVIEPELENANFFEGADKFAQVQRMVEKMLYIWESKDSVDIQEKFGSGKFYQVEKEIYYDTDYIEEAQTEKVRMCTNCSGYLMIESKATRDLGNFATLLAISIPIGACQGCIAEGYELYEEGMLSQGKYNLVMLQDKVNDLCFSYDLAQKKEWKSEGPKLGV